MAHAGGRAHRTSLRPGPRQRGAAFAALVLPHTSSNPLAGEVALAELALRAAWWVVGARLRGKASLAWLAACTHVFGRLHSLIHTCAAAAAHSAAGAVKRRWHRMRAAVAADLAVRAFRRCLAAVPTYLVAVFSAQKRISLGYAKICPAAHAGWFRPGGVSPGTPRPGCGDGK